MKKCTKCGQEIYDNSKFCPNCGDAVDKDSNSLDHSHTKISIRNEYTKLIVVIVILFIIVGVSLFFALRYSLKNNILVASTNSKNNSSEVKSDTKDTPKATKDTADKTSPKDTNTIVIVKGESDNTNTSTSSYYSYGSDFVFPYSGSVRLTDSELAPLSKYTLGIARNEIYARHGYIFHQQPYISYFNSKSWYYPDSSFKGSNGELNSIEEYNIQLIIKHENM